jgi:hypothetical protein
MQNRSRADSALRVFIILLVIGDQWGVNTVTQARSTKGSSFQTGYQGLTKVS